MAFVTRKTVAAVGYPHEVKSALTALQSAVLADDIVGAREATRDLSQVLENLDDTGENPELGLPADLVSYLHAMAELDMLTGLSDVARERLSNRYGHVASLLNDHEHRRAAAAPARPARLDQLFDQAAPVLDAHSALRDVIASDEPRHGLTRSEANTLARLLVQDAADRGDAYANDREQAAEQKPVGRGQEVATALLFAGATVTGTDILELVVAGQADLLSTAAGISVVALGITALLRESTSLTAKRVTRQASTGTIEADVTSFIPDSSTNDPGEQRRIRLTSWAAQRTATAVAAPTRA